MSSNDEDRSEARETLARRLVTAARGGGDELAPLVHDASEEVLRALVANPALDEADLLVLLERRDLPADLLRAIASNAALTRSYRVRLALVRHPQTPASASLRLVQQIHLFDLVAVSLVPHVPREVRAAAEGAILSQLASVPLGARISLARRTGSETVLARLLVDRDPPVVDAALSNARLVEASVVRAIRHATVPAHTVAAITRHPKWSPRRDVRYALVRSRHTPTARALEFVASMTREELRSLAGDRAVPPQIRSYLARLVGSRE